MSYESCAYGAMLVYFIGGTHTRPVSARLCSVSSLLRSKPTCSSSPVVNRSPRVQDVRTPSFSDFTSD